MSNKSIFPQNFRDFSNFRQQFVLLKINTKFTEEDEAEVEYAKKMWKEYEETVAGMDALRKEYSTSGAQLIGDIKTATMNSNDAYFSQSQNAYEWSSLVQPLLKATMNIGKSEGITNALNKILDDGVVKLGAAQEKLQQIAETFQPLSSGISELNTKLSAAFEEKQKFFDDKLKQMRAADKKGPTGPFEKELVPLLMAKLEAIKKFSGDLMQTFNDETRNIESQKAKLQDEIDQIETVKSKIAPLKTVLNSDASSMTDVKKLSQDMISASEKYRQRRNEKSNMI